MIVRITSHIFIFIFEYLKISEKIKIDPTLVLLRLLFLEEVIMIQSIITKIEYWNLSLKREMYFFALSTGVLFLFLKDFLPLGISFLGGEKMLATYLEKGLIIPFIVSCIVTLGLHGWLLSFAIQNQYASFETGFKALKVLAVLYLGSSILYFVIFGESVSFNTRLTIIIYPFLGCLYLMFQNRKTNPNSAELQEWQLRQTVANAIRQIKKRDK